MAPSRAPNEVVDVQHDGGTLHTSFREKNAGIELSPQVLAHSEMRGGDATFSHQGRRIDDSKDLVLSGRKHSHDEA